MDTSVSLRSVPGSELTSSQVNGAHIGEMFDSIVVALSPKATLVVLCMLHPVG